MGIMKLGENAPEFTLPNKDGKLFNLKDYAGKPLVIFFYPNNIGWVCTREVCYFRDSYEKFVEMGAEVIGISPNTMDNHKKFHDAHRVNYTILSDKNGAIGKLYGANGILPGRVTFVVDKNGKIALNHHTSWLSHSSHIENSLRIIELLNSQ
ncbi:hypothetical protein ACTA71_006900 [Dictyostelium dimigraforme]